MEGGSDRADASEKTTATTRRMREETERKSQHRRPPPPECMSMRAPFPHPLTHHRWTRSASKRNLLRTRQKRAKTKGPKTYPFASRSREHARRVPMVPGARWPPRWRSDQSFASRGMLRNASPTDIKRVVQCTCLGRLCHPVPLGQDKWHLRRPRPILSQYNVSWTSPTDLRNFKALESRG